MATPINNDNIEYHIKNGGSVTGFQCLFYYNGTLYHGNRLEDSGETWKLVDNKLQNAFYRRFLGGTDSAPTLVGETEAPTITFEGARKAGTVYIKASTGKYLRLLSNSEFSWTVKPLTAWLITPPLIPTPC